MVKSILVPMGTSEYSYNALMVAVKSANLLNSTLRLLYVEDVAKMLGIIMGNRMETSGMSADLSRPDIPKQELKRIEEELAMEREHVKKYYDEVKDKIKGEHSLIIRKGDVAREILKASRSVDAIIMGKSLEKYIKGLQSSIFTVIQYANRPMVAVCREKHLPLNILVAYDGGRAANNALRAIGDFIPIVAPELITILTVKSTEKEARPFLDEGEEYFLPYKVPVEKLWKRGSVSKNIIKTAEEKKCSLIVMGGYGDNKIAEFLLGASAEKVLRGTDTTVILCNA